MVTVWVVYMNLSQPGGAGVDFVWSDSKICGGFAVCKDLKVIN